MPDISFNKDDKNIFHDQIIWGKNKNIIDPEMSKTSNDAEVQIKNVPDIFEDPKEKIILMDPDK